MERGKPCVFFDRDGIVNEPPVVARYVRNLSEFRFIPEFLNVLEIVRQRGYEAVIVTNQKGVSTGIMSMEDVEAIHAEIRRIVEGAGLRLLDILVCTASDDKHPNRKPNPGMLFEAARRHHLDLSRSWMIGDNEKDVEAGKRAGCRTVLVSPTRPANAPDYQVRDMKELVLLLEQVLPPVAPFDRSERL